MKINNILFVSLSLVLLIPAVTSLKCIVCGDVSTYQLPSCKNITKRNEITCTTGVCASITVMGELTRLCADPKICDTVTVQNVDCKTCDKDLCDPNAATHTNVGLVLIFTGLICAALGR